MIEDPEVRAWKNCHPNDLWIFDKLLLSKKLATFVRSGLRARAGS